ncbi:MAG: glycoside hydrolase family 2 protein [Clostridiales bacterium]|nr:glycoside hydrolase family 2 protein [Clostridiales bacterium]
MNGSWRLRKEGEKETLPATVPGCNFLDLMDNGVIENPHYADREKDVQWIARENWEYSREFEADEALLSQNKVELVALSLDTLAVISLNGREIARTDNIYRTYIFDVKRYLNPGKNRIQILFLSPFPYIKERQKLLRLPHNSMGAPGCPHIRKVPSHFGWDFAPMVPQCGIVKDIFLRGYSRGKLYDLECRQEHGDGRVSLKIKCRVDQMEREDLVCRVRVTDPDGGVLEHTEPVSSNLAQVCFDIEKPQLWWCSGLGEQPLYRVDCALEAAGEAVDARSMEIGLRTIVLSKAKDVHGTNFCSQGTGGASFAKGANWIPADCFSPRISRAVLEQRIRAMKRANMNMVRVWGGGFYESDDFYELCDRYGILVWQDMCFACSGYPFALDDFKENVFREIRDNVMRLRHHASLALWCGNNEIESMSAAWSYRRGIIRDTGEFFYKILPNWVRKFDDVTEYWSCSPSSGEYMKNINSDDFGDTHLWNVWHGMRSVQFYRKRYTRFCSEFGLQSYPSMNCLREVIPEDQRYLKSTALDAHQKCGDGDTKMLYYVNKRFWEPKEFKDLVYLTQLAQLECIRDATEHWRRNRGRCNGALYWQLNDCWPAPPGPGWTITATIWR